MKNRISDIKVEHHSIQLPKPYEASWDSRPRTEFVITVVEVWTENGLRGIGSGDKLYGIEDYRNLFIGQDPLDLERHTRVIDNVSFHAGRFWPLDAALWDLAGKVKNQPVYEMVGNEASKIRPYASSGALRPAAELADFAEGLVKKNYRALKIRFGRAKLDDDLAVVAAIRERVGDQMEIMVDTNQGWRMPWDIQEPWNYSQAFEVGKELEKYNVFWMEEPLHRADYEGMRRLRKNLNVRIAGGEMTREMYEFREILERECLDVYQPDVVLTGGMLGLKALVEKLNSQGLIFSPHTWGNGIGLLANAHIAAGASKFAPYLEFPIDPPEWLPEHRDFVQKTPVLPNSEGWLDLSGTVGLGIELK